MVCMCFTVNKMKAFFGSCFSSTKTYKSNHTQIVMPVVVKMAQHEPRDSILHGFMRDLPTGPSHKLAHVLCIQLCRLCPNLIPDLAICAGGAGVRAGT